MSANSIERTEASRKTKKTGKGKTLRRKNKQLVNLKASGARPRRIARTEKKIARLEAAVKPEKSDTPSRESMIAELEQMTKE